MRFAFKSTSNPHDEPITWEVENPKRAMVQRGIRWAKDNNIPRDAVVANFRPASGFAYVDYSCGDLAETFKMIKIS